MFAERTKWNFATNRLTEALAAHRASGKPLLDLTISNPTECGFRYEERALREALTRSGALHYEPDPRGIGSARAAVARYYAGRGLPIELENIFLTTSTSEAYSFVFRLLCNAGDEILVPAPSYPLFEFLADIHDVRLVRYPLLYDHGWQMDFHAIERALSERTRAVIVVHPNNPTGHFTKRAEACRLNEICAAREMALIADEVFLDFALLNQAPQSFALNAGALTFATSGLSKISGLPQMKAAWLVVNGPREPKEQALARLEVIADTYLSMNTPVQLALPVFIDLRHKFQEQVLDRVRKNLKELDHQLATQQACSRLQLEGGWYAVVRLPAISDDQEFAIDLLNGQGVYVHPGHFYDFSDKHTLVLSLIAPAEGFAEGLRRLLSQANQ